MEPGSRVGALWLFLLAAAGAIAFSRQTAPAADADGDCNERLREAASSLASLERQIAEVVKKVEPSMVQCLAPGDRDEDLLNQRLAPGEKGIFSGTLVTAEGHIVSCAHHRLAPGTPVTLRLSDGRTVPGKVLGRHKRWDLSMLKIIAPGPWPHVELGASTGALPGDLYVLLGYPRRYLVVNRHKPVRPSVRLAWGLNAVRGSGDLPVSPRRGEVVFSAVNKPGDSGGGLFDLEGRLIAISLGQADAPERRAGQMVEMLQIYWGDLIAGKTLDGRRPKEEEAVWEKQRATISKAAATADRGVRPAADALESAFLSILAEAGVTPVDIRCDGKRKAIGTIVGRDGWIVTKASELAGREFSCRFADGRELAASVHNVSQEHDMALLKVATSDLRENRWSQRAELPVGALIAAVSTGQSERGFRKPPTCRQDTLRAPRETERTLRWVGVATDPMHGVRRIPGSLWVGKVREANGGMEVYKEQGLVFVPPESPRFAGDRPESQYLDVTFGEPEAPVRIGDVITHVEGRPSPVHKTWTELTDKDSGVLSQLAAGDLIRLTLRRGREVVELPSRLVEGEEVINCGRRSPRFSAFPAVFDSDISLPTDSLGGPVIDRSGEIVGVAIARSMEGFTYILPATLVRQVVEELRRRQPVQQPDRSG